MVFPSAMLTTGSLSPATLTRTGITWSGLTSLKLIVIIYQHTAKLSGRAYVQHGEIFHARLSMYYVCLSTVLRISLR